MYPPYFLSKKGQGGARIGYSVPRVLMPCSFPKTKLYTLKMHQGKYNHQFAVEQRHSAYPPKKCTHLRNGGLAYIEMPLLFNLTRFVKCNVLKEKSSNLLKQK